MKRSRLAATIASIVATAATAPVALGQYPSYPGADAYAPSAGPPQTVVPPATTYPPASAYGTPVQPYAPAPQPYGVPAVTTPPAPVVYPPSAYPPQGAQPRAADPLSGSNPVFNDPAGTYVSPLSPSVSPGGAVDPFAPVIAEPYIGPAIRDADLIINGYPGRTGRIAFGAAVNSDTEVTGQITVDERNFDITRWPRSFADLASGNAFRGAGQTFRIEAAPGSRFKRYTVSFAEPFVFDSPFSLSVSGFLFDRRFEAWDEERLGGRLALGYRANQNLSFSVGVSGQNVDIDPGIAIPQLLDVEGDSELYSGEFRVIHDTRDRTIQAARGHYAEFSYEKVFGSFDYSRFESEFRQYFLLRERADGTGRQTLSYSTRLGFSGDDTPIFENFFAGGYATLRGFEFRDASPTVSNVSVGGRFQWLNTVEYMFPLTADDAFRGVAFVDFGTVESDIEINSENFRVAPGVGLRVAIPMLGPAPLAFDFAFPVSEAEGDETQMFSFYMSLIR